MINVKKNNDIRNVEFQPVSDSFLKKLNDDVKEIKRINDVLVFADKTTNIYPVQKETYRKLLHENITKSYKKTRSPMCDKINNDAANIAADLHLEQRMESYANKEAFITLKDHKDNFANHPKCRLINPAKSEMGRVSKIILECINSKVREATGLTQWRNSSEVIKWFEKFSINDNCTFIQFDVCEFYPSISESLLTNSIEYARSYCKISQNDVNIIMHARQSLLFSEKVEWVRKKNDGTEDFFDVTMGSFDGAEVCEIVGLYILSQIEKKFKNASIGL